jgi:tetratricopeptide (TPR) repeat protein
VVLERFTSTDRAANIPEFVALPAGSIAKIEERFLDAYSFLRAGMANERTGDYPGAVRIYRRGLAVAPENVELLNSLGFALFQQGKSQEAVDALEKAVAADPKHWKAHNNLALAAIDVGELELAEAHFRESLALSPQPAIYNDLGFVLERQGLADEAVGFYRKALELDPGSAAAHYNLAASLARSGALSEAERHFRAALAERPSAQSYVGLGLVLRQQGRADDAIASLRAAIEADPEQPAAYDALGTILAEQGKLEEAAHNFGLAVRKRPSAAAHEKLGDVLMRLGRTDEARREMEMAKALAGAR